MLNHFDGAHQLVLEERWCRIDENSPPPATAWRVVPVWNDARIMVDPFDLDVGKHFFGDETMIEDIGIPPDALVFPAQPINRPSPRYPVYVTGQFHRRESSKTARKRFRLPMRWID